MNNHKILHVFMEDEKVGTLATARNHVVAFEYDDQWLKNGFSISPFSLPLEKRVFLPRGYDLGQRTSGDFPSHSQSGL